MRFGSMIAGVICALGLSLVTTNFVGVLRVQADEASKRRAEIIAVAVRKRGNKCDQPKAAEIDPSIKKEPNKKAWILDCGSARYRVKFNLDVMASVEKLGTKTDAQKDEPANKKN